MTEQLRGWRSSCEWQRRAAELLGTEDADIHSELDAARDILDRAAEEIEEPDDKFPLYVAHALVYLMHVGHFAERDLGIMMSVVENRLKSGRDPIEPDWEAETPKEFLPEPEEKEPKPKPKPVAEALGETWVDVSGSWDEINSISADVVVTAGEFAYGIWHKEAPDMDGLVRGRRTVFKKGVVVLSDALKKKPSMLLPVGMDPGGSFYVLALADVAGKRVRLVGWAASEELMHAPTTEIGEERAMCYALPESRLHSMRGEG